MTDSWVFFLVLAAALVALYLWIRERSRDGSRSGGGLGGATPHPTLYYRPTCPHCTSFMPTWRSVKGRIGGREVNCDATPDLCAGIEGVPTIKGPDGSVYSGPRTAEGLLSWSSRT